MARYQKSGNKVIDTQTGEWLSPERSQHIAEISGGWQYVPTYSGQAETSQPVSQPVQNQPVSSQPTNQQSQEERWKNKWQNIAGITGFYRVQGQPTVYAIGEGGNAVESEAELAWVSAQTGTPLTANQVQEISAGQAAKFGIQVPGAAQLPVELPEEEHVRFQGQDKVYLYDRESKTYRPVDSPAALVALLGVSSIEEAFQHVTVLSPEDKNAPEWAGNIISESASIGDDGTVPEDSPLVEGGEVGDGKVGIYGKNRVDEKHEKVIANNLSFALTDAKLKGEISEEAFDKYLNSQSETLAKYASAWLYGGYSVQDIFRDLKAKQLFDEGDERYKDFKGFDENLSAEEWYQTEEGKKSLGDSLLAPPSTLAISDDVWKLPLFKIPDEAFQTLVQPLDINSPEFKEEAEKIQASYYDIMMQKAEADTDQAKAVADNNWEIFKKNVEKKLSIELSNNAKAAWGQLQEAFSGFTERGLGDSGLFNEAMDKYLGSVRDNDELKRENKIEEEEFEERKYLLNSGSSEEIAKFIAENGEEKAKDWGLIPSDEVLNWFSETNLKKLYPDMSDEEIKTIIGMVVDESGNFKSKLQQNLYTKKYNLQEQKKTYQQKKLEEKKLLEAEKAYLPFTSDKSMSSWINSLQETIEKKKREGEPVEEEEEEIKKIIEGEKEIEEEEGITPVTYEDLYEKNGIIYTKDGKVYADPNKLATDLGLAENVPIDWSKIKKEEEGASMEKAASLTGQQSLTNIYQSRQDVQDTIKKAFPGQDPFQKGTKANTWLNNWWNRVSAKEFPGVTLTQPTAQKVDTTTPVSGYASLRDVNGEIRTSAGRVFGKGKTPQESQAELAGYLKTQPHQIDWSKIKKETPKVEKVPVSQYYDKDKSGQRPSNWQGEWTIKDQGQLRTGKLKRR